MKKNIMIGLLFLISIVLLTGCFGEKAEYAAKDQYNELNIQELHNDYDSNEISAKDKYTGKYYYFTGEIREVTEYLGDYYLEFRFKSENKNTKTSTIELNAYFESRDMISKVKKGDKVTVYCKFKQRSIEDYGGITSYSLHSCKFENDF